MKYKIYYVWEKCVHSEWEREKEGLALRDNVVLMQHYGGRGNVGTETGNSGTGVVFLVPVVDAGASESEVWRNHISVNDEKRRRYRKLGSGGRGEVGRAGWHEERKQGERDAK